MAGSIGSSGVGGGGRQRPASPNRTRRKVNVSFPLTSMIDITFLLLAYFLMTTVFRQAEGQLPGMLPKGRPDPMVKVIPVQVHAIGANCESAVYSLDGQGEPLRSPRELADSLEALRDELGGNATVIMLIQADRAVRWRYVVEACNQAARVNFQSTIRIQDQT